MEYVEQSNKEQLNDLYRKSGMFFYLKTVGLSLLEAQLYQHLMTVAGLSYAHRALECYKPPASLF